VIPCKIFIVFLRQICYAEGRAKKKKLLVRYIAIRKIKTMPKRDLTTLEYFVLGVLSLKPQSGYDIVTAFEDGSYSWSASPGSVYPMLKRLESQGMLTSDIEIEHEIRARKVYSLTEEGARSLDDWLREIPKMRPFYQEREIALLRFQFMERRLSQAEVLTWLNNYLDAVRYATSVNTVYVEPMKKMMDDDSIFISAHTQLLMEAYIMEMNTLRTWLELARGRLLLQQANPPK
jgi:DNA-binding PadR family transcriptional regulator